MDFDLTPEQRQVRDVARQFAEAELGDKIAPFDERHEFPHEIVAKLGPLGFLGAVIPEELGGAGLDYVSYALIVEELCRGDASVGITMWAHNSLCTNHIASFASAATPFASATASFAGRDSCWEQAPTNKPTQTTRTMGGRMEEGPPPGSATA